MSLTPDTVPLSAFTRMLQDPELRQVLNLDLSDQAAERVISSPEIVAHYYELWCARTAQRPRPVPERPAQQSTAAPARAQTQPRTAVPAAESPPQTTQRTPPPVSLNAGVQSLIWPAASFLVLTIIAGIGGAIVANGDRSAGLGLAGFGFLLAICCTVVGAVCGAIALQEGIISPGAPKRTTVLVLGGIGLSGSLLLAASWIVGWMTL